MRLLTILTLLTLTAVTYADPASLYSTIVGGRPNGMPAWRGKIPDYQVWQLVTYVEAMRAGRGIAAPPGPRQEHLQAGEGKISR